MSWWLRAAAAYNILWGASVVLFPNLAFDLLGIARPLYPSIWQCVGMIVGVYGVGYAIASLNPLRHWPIVLVGLLGKIFGPIGFLWAASSNQLPWSMAWTILTNDILWWIPFTLILTAAYHNWRTATAQGPARSEADAIRAATTNAGKSLADLSRERPVLAVFLRHAGCTFCREALADVARQREAIEREGVQIALVHMGDEASAAEFFAEYGLGDLPRISDPDRTLYASLGLQRGRLRQLFGLKVWLRGIAASLKGHRVGKLMGDGFQMPGVFLIDNGRVAKAFRHATAADRPDYTALACGIAG